MNQKSIGLLLKYRKSLLRACFKRNDIEYLNKKPSHLFLDKKNFFDKPSIVYLIALSVRTEYNQMYMLNRINNLSCNILVQKYKTENEIKHIVNTYYSIYSTYLPKNQMASILLAYKFTEDIYYIFYYIHYNNLIPYDDTNNIHIHLAKNIFGEYGKEHVWFYEGNINFLKIKEGDPIMSKYYPYLIYS
jgi:hypothetical protein